VFLAVLGSSIGYLVGRQVNTHQQTVEQPPDGTGDQQQPTGGNTPTTEGKSCPSVSERDARKEGSPGGLVQVLHITTKQSEVWICRAADGEFWYQGHRLGGPIDSDQYGILIRQVQRNPGTGGYVATNEDQNGRTRYLVDSSKLVIEHNGQRQASEDAVSSE
jgi:hypothetical protein